MKQNFFFCALPLRNVVSWTTMLMAYVEQGQGVKALLLYRQMQEKTGGCADELTFVTALQACTCFAEEDAPFVQTQSDNRINLEIGKALHVDAKRKDLLLSVIVISALVSMYSARVVPLLKPRACLMKCQKAPFNYGV